MKRALLVLGGFAFVAYATGLSWIEHRSRAFATPLASVSGSEAGPVVAVAFYDDRPARRRLRTATAARLVETGRADFLVTVGGWRPGRGYLGSREMRDDALAGGVRASQVVHDQGSNDSTSNLAGARATILEAIGQPAAIILVSDRYHLLRLSLLTRDAGLTAPLYFQATPDHLGMSGRLGRLNYEGLAYLSMLLPKGFINAAIGRLRLADFDARRSPKAA